MIGRDTIELLTSINERKMVHETFKKIFNREVNNVYSEHILTLDNGQSYYIAWKDSLLKEDEFEDQILSVGIDITEKIINEEKLRYKFKLEKSLNEVRDIITNGVFDYKYVSEVISNTVKVDRVEIIEYANKLNNRTRKNFEYTENKAYELNNIIKSQPEVVVEEWKDYLLKNKTLVVKNTNTYHGHSKLKDFIKETDIKSFITIPIINNNCIYGTITFNIFNSSDYSWNDADLKYLLQVGEIVNYEMLRRKQVEYTERTFRNAVDTLSSVVQMKDAYTASHQLRVAALAVAIAKKMELNSDTVETINLAAKLHDIGKINVPGAILAKPGKITEIEFLLIKEHSKYGYEILKKIDFEKPIAEIVHQHHERIDGTGYRS